MPADDVPLTDLEVVQRWSLAVRAPVASRAELVAALRRDLAWLTGQGDRARAAPARSRPVPTDRVPRRSVAPQEQAAPPQQDGPEGGVRPRRVPVRRSGPRGPA